MQYAYLKTQHNLILFLLSLVGFILMFYSKTVYHCKIIKAYGVATTRVRTTINENIIITLLKLSQEQLKNEPSNLKNRK